MVRLLMSVGSWLVWRLAEKATLPEPERTDMPRALPAGSDDGVESHTTKHFPSRMMGSVSFWPLDSMGLHSRSTANSIGRSKVTNLGCMTLNVDVWLTTCDSSVKRRLFGYHMGSPSL